MFAAIPGAIRIAIFGDSGSGTADQKAVARQLRRVEDDLRYVFPLGDNVYFTGQAKRFEGAFLKPYRRFLERRTETGERQIAFHSALGNHDVLRTCSLRTARRRNPRAGTGRPTTGASQGATSRSSSPSPPSAISTRGATTRWTCSGPAGDLIAEVLVLDSNTLPSEKHPDRQDTAQLDWLTETIRASRERARRHAVEPWRIVTLHHPIRTPSARGYLFGFGGHQEDPSLLRAIENTLGREEDAPDQVLGGQLQPLLTGGAVDAVFAGHNHFYARLVPDADRIRHFVSGGGGIGVYEPDTDSTPTAAGGGFHHFVTAVLTRDRFEYCTIDSLGRVRDHGFWRRDSRQDPDQPLEGERYRAVCRP